jgi:hypothetical protein
MKNKDVKNRLKQYLLKGGKITHNQALKWYRTNRLAVYIQRLRDTGMRNTLKTKMIYRNGDCFAQYFHEI